MFDNLLNTSANTVGASVGARVGESLAPDQKPRRHGGALACLSRDDCEQ
jgi:hypothetical protein